MTYDRTPARSRRRVAGGAFLLLALLPAPAAAAPALQSLEEELLVQAKDVLQKLRSHKCKNVGVLPFQADKTSAGTAGDDGSLGKSLAQRLEVALVLVNDPKSPVGILQNAAARAAKVKGADPGTPKGRAALFGELYPLAWGKEEVKADAFLTGIFKVSGNPRELEVTVQAWGKGKDDLEEVQRFKAFAEGGTAVSMRDPKKHPLEEEAGPVQLVIRNKDVPVPAEFKAGQASIREPGRKQEKQDVSFVLKRKPGDKERYAVVLKVQGENVVLGETLPDLDCTKIVLEPDGKPFVLRHFLTEDKKPRPFRLAARKDGPSGADEPAALTITVFRQRRAAEKEDPQAAVRKEDQLAAIRRGQLLADRPANLEDLKEQLSKNGNRGVVIDDGASKADLRRVEFRADPVPVVSATVRVTGR